MPIPTGSTDEKASKPAAALLKRIEDAPIDYFQSYIDDTTAKRWGE